MDKERILSKIDELDSYLGELDGIKPIDFEIYGSSVEKKRACERLLQISIESVIDVCNIVFSDLKLGLPRDEDEVIIKLGGEQVRLTTLDRFVNEQGLSHVDMIKADVEGYEAEVIRGSEQTIREHSPKLAFSIYHRTSDLIDLPLQVNKLGIYDLFIRSRIEGAFGFTLFARPKEGKG